MRKRLRVLEYLERFLGFVLPRSCLICGNPIGPKEVVCDSCLNAVEGPLTGALSFGKPLDGVHHFWWYEDAVESAVKLYKYADHPSLSRVLATWLDRTMRYHSLNLPVTFVPSTPSALKERGFDTMEKISMELEKLGYEIIATLTASDTPPQASLKRSERLRNVHGKFQLLKDVHLPKEVVIVDDVYTTGATLKECAKVLKKNGVKTVIAITVARAKIKRAP